MRSPSRPPPLQIYHHPAAHLVSPSSPVFLASRTTDKATSARTPAHRLTPRKGGLLSRGLPPLSPVSEIEESCRPSIFNTDDVQGDGLLDTQLRSMLAEIDTFKSGWYEEDDNEDDETTTELHHELSNVQIIRYSRAEVKPPVKSPHGATHLIQYTRFESNHSSPPSSMIVALKNPDTSHSIEVRESGPPRSESARSSSSSLGGILFDFPMPPSALPEPIVPVSSPVESIGKPLPSPVSPTKPGKPRLAADLLPRASASPDDAFLYPRPAPRPPPRSASTPNLKVVSSMLSSLDAPATNTLASRRVRRPANLQPVSSTSPRRIMHVTNSSSSSIEEEILGQMQPEAPMVSRSQSPRRARTVTSGETSVNSPWRETIDAMYNKPPIPPKPTHFLSPPSPPSPSASPSGSNSLPVTFSSSSSSTSPSTPVAPMSPNTTVPRGILKKRLPPPPTFPPPPLPLPPLPPIPPLPPSPLRSGVPPTPSTASSARSPSRSNPSLDSKSPQLHPSLTPPATPFPPPHDKRNLPAKPPTPPKSYVIPSLPCGGPGSPEPGSGSGSESSGSDKTVKSHSSSSSSSFGSVRESIRERYLRRGVSRSSSSSSHYSRSSLGEGERRSKSRAGSTMSSSSSSGSSVDSRGANGLPTRAAIPLALLIR